MKKTDKIVFTLADPNSTPVEDLSKMDRSGSVRSSSESPLVKSILNTLNGGSEQSIERLAFERDPSNNSEYAAIYREKLRLIPDRFLKRIAIQDDLVASIVNARANHVSAFGRPQMDRFSTGYKLEFRPGVVDRLSDEEKKDLKKKMDYAIDMFGNCGSRKGWSDREDMTLAQFLSMQVRNALIVGKFATEIVHVYDPHQGKNVFHSFRPIDAGTIYFAAPYKTAAESVRKQARLLLQQLKNEKFEPERFENEEYAWIQVIETKPVQAFTAEECLVHNVYPVTDVELQGYPLTPIDTIIAAVTTHINITKHNRLYFESGRAARGMLVIQSDDVDDAVVARIRNQFNASINSVNNAWRMPVFGVGKQESIAFQAIDSGGRDMEFQYLSDTNARVILSAFQMSPEELPGYAHLSRGTNSQALSECLDKSTEIITPLGQMSIESFLNNRDSADTTLWNGTSWVNARVFNTGKKKLTKTVLSNGISIKTSPDHSFRVIGEDGEPTWKTQSELCVGDYVLVNKTPVEGIGQVPSYNGKQLTPEMMEVLGWLTGDGNIQANKETSHSLKFFYHHSKESDIWQRHYKILKDFGLNATQHEKTISTEEAESIKERYGFKSVADKRIWTMLNDSSFVRWLFSIGFQSSSDGKVIPAFIYTLPEEHRSAFLRGLFSADGGISKGSCGSIILTAAHEKVRHGVRQLLLTLGIRTRFSEGKTKQVFKGGSEREITTGNNKLYIKDKRAFFDKVGFLQDHKQPLPEWLEGNEASEKLPLSTQIKYIRKLLNSNLPRATKRNLYGFDSQDTKKRCSVPRLVSLLEKAEIEVPVWLTQYHCEQVQSLTTFDEFVEMADVTMHDDTHAFIANGMVVHNSNNEYKLSAARDVGIRPLLAHFQDFLNERIFPLIDEELSKVCYLRLIGLDAETPEKENVRIQQDAPVHMTFDEILQKVEKRHVGRKLGGKFPFNPQWQQIVQSYLTFGEIQEAFFGMDGAAKNPENQWYQNPMWFQWKSLQLQLKQFDMQVQQMQQQQQMAQQQAMAQQQQGGQPPDGQPPEGGGPEGGGEQPPEGQEQGQEGQPEQQQGQQPPQEQQQPEELTRNLNELQATLGKAEHQLNHNQKETLAYQRKMMNHFMDTFEKDKKKALDKIVEIATEHFEDVKDK